LLVLPLRDINGELHSLQFIAPDNRFDGKRNKTFPGGGRVAGCCFTLADTPNGALVVCEGYATGASIHEATGLPPIDIEWPKPKPLPADLPTVPPFNFACLPDTFREWIEDIADGRFHPSVRKGRCCCAGQFRP
jgi:hypothetical protein